MIYGVHTAYPTEQDLEAFLVSAGMLSSPRTAAQAPLDLDSLVRKARREWEQRTGYQPFLPMTADVTKLLNPPGPTPRKTAGTYGGFGEFAFGDGFWGGGQMMGGHRELTLPNGLVSVTSVGVGFTPTITGAILTFGQQYWLEPEDAADKGVPYERIRFLAPIYGPPQSVQIIGRFGYGAAVPAGTTSSTTITAGANSATQALASTTGLQEGQLLFFETAGVQRTIESVSGDNVVLNQSVTSTTDEVVNLIFPMPDDAWQAILEGAASPAAVRLQALNFAGLQSWREADATSETYGPRPYGDFIDAWKDSFENGIDEYLRAYDAA